MKYSSAAVRKPQIGFTLIELLVVLAIIASLSAVLVPAFNSVREKARQVSCISNERQLGMAFLEYEQDFDETLPCGNYDFRSGSGEREQGWAGQIYSYVKNPLVFACPDDPTHTTSPTEYTVSYAINQAFLFGTADYETNSPTYPSYMLLKAAKWDVAADTVLLVEVSGCEASVENPTEKESPSVDGMSGYVSGNESDFVAIPGANAVTPMLQTGIMSDNLSAYSGSKIVGPKTGRHLPNGSNYLMSDGHVKFLKGSNVSCGLSATNSNEHAGNDWGAAGTSVLTSNGTNPIVATFSPI